MITNKDASVTTLPGCRQTTSSLESTMIEPLYHQMDEEDILEDIQLYQPGGFHPIMPFDFLGDNQRFEVWTKLGQGTFGIVWLCHDNQKDKFCAVKVLRHDVSSQEEILSEVKVSNILQGVSAETAWENHVVMPTEHFWQNGPNGTHLCLVMSVLGPSVSRTRCYNAQNTNLLKNICFQLAEGMAFLHGHGICHGDFRPANILFKTTLSNLTLDEMDAYMPSPRAHAILRLDGYDGSEHAPKYAIEPMFLELEDRYITRSIAIIDFGVAFDALNSAKHASIPKAWAAPESQPEIDAPPQMGSDLWALGITVFETLCGSTPFQTFGGAFSWSMVEEALGPVPEPYRSKLIQQQYHEIHVSNLDLTSPLLNAPDEFGSKQSERQDRHGTSDFLHDVVARRTENLHPDWNDTTKRIEPRALKGWAPPEEAVHNAQLPIHCLDMSSFDQLQDDDNQSTVATQDNPAVPELVAPEIISAASPSNPACITRQLDPAAVPGAVDLLKQLLRWLPEDRVPADQLLDHEWFEDRNKKRAGSICGLFLEEIHTIKESLSESETNLGKASSSSTPLADQKHPPQAMDGEDAVLPDEQAAKDRDNLPDAFLLGGTDLRSKESNTNDTSREETPLEANSSLGDDNTSADSGIDEELQGRSWGRWSLAIDLVALGIIIWVGVLGRPINGICGLGVDACDTVWQFARRMLRL